MKICSKIIWRPLCFFILLGFSSYMIWKLCGMTKDIEQHETLLSERLRNTSFSEIEHTAKLLIPLNSSTSNMARTLSSSLNGIELSFDEIQSKVAPILFIAISTIPHISHVAYCGLDGLLFSYYHTDDQTFAVFANSSSNSTCYTQPVNRDNGKLYGKPVISYPRINIFNTTSFLQFVNTTTVFSSLGTEMNQGQDLVFLNNVAMDGRGVISIGFPAKVVIDHFSDLDFYGGDFHLATRDGQVLVQTKLEDTLIDVKNSTISVQSFEEKSGYYSCSSDGGGLNNFFVKIRRKKHIFYCSTIKIAGIELVYVLSYPPKGMESFVHRNSMTALILLVVMFGILVISFTIFIIMILKAARREMLLCAALVRQMDSTQQAERKSMKKSDAFASATHNMRVSLSVITGSIEICSNSAKPNTSLEANLVDMYTSVLDLLGILNSVLDTSKIEAGKMQLEEEEFELAQLVDDVVDMFHPIGAKKGVDVIFDPLDNSYLKFNRVIGDRIKLKQIFSNLLSNAIKFTSEGHVTVRTLVRKRSIENAIIASNQSSVWSCLSGMFYRKNGSSFGTLDTLHTGQENPNCMEFIFDVEDTGKGIPKDKQESVFENYVQVKETALGQEGCGLGLGIVQSLVRLMGGEIKILEKENGERGTCFRFNIFLHAIQPVDTEGQDDEHQNEVHRIFGLHLFRSPSPRLEGPHVVLLIWGEERRIISKRVIENLGGSVEIVKQSQDLSHVLETVKQKMNLSQRSFSDISGRDLFPNEESSSTKDEIESQPKKSHSKCSSSSILVVVDARCGNFSELSSILANFRKDVHNSCCKFVWLDNPITRDITKELEDEQISLPPFDHILLKPFHGSHLYHILGLLPEFAGRIQPNLLKLGQPQTIEGERYSSQPFPSNAKGKTLIAVQENELEEVVIHKNVKENNKILNGKNVLVVEDNKVLCTIATRILHKLGAKIEIRENGKDAVDLICKNLNNDRSNNLPFDFIFMDCQMPVMDGYEATKLIRKEEEVHGIHIPIIALTACSRREDIQKTIDAGMDFHLAKPILTDNLIKVIERYYS